MDQIEKILSAGWKDAAVVSCVSGNLAEDQGPASFRLIPGASVDSERQHVLEALQEDLTATAPAATAFLIHDALILGNGFLVYSPDGLVKESRYLANNVERRIELSLRDATIALDDDVTWIIAGNASSKYNYWHWFAQMLPAILHCRDFARSTNNLNYGIVTGPLRDWQLESLAVLGIPPTHVVQLNVFQNARAKKCLYSDLLSDAHVFSANCYRKSLRETFIKWANGADSAAEKLVISRKDTKKRPLLNEDALHAALTDKGYKVVTGGTLTLREQIQYFHGASVIVAPHGAGSTNVLFGRPGARYVELAQLSYANAGPLSMCKTSQMLTWVDLFEDDGKGQSTEGWTAAIDVVLETIADAESATT